MHRMNSVRLASLVPTLLIGAAAVSFAAADLPAAKSSIPDDAQFSRSKITGIVANARKIVGAAGVEELVAIPIGGTQQWISVRGHDRDNPILLMIHGGPASPEIPTSWFFQSGWEDYFTVVQWDQRGSGKSYNANDPKTIKPTLSLERITRDAEEVVRYLRAKFHKDKIFVLGHSWGSVVGIQLAHRHPEWLHAYVGMGQVISGQENERVGYRMTLQVAEAAHNAEAVNDLKSIAPYPNADGTMPLEKIDKERKWSVNYGGLIWGRKSLDYYFDLMQLSPDYTEADIAAVDKGSELSLGPLLGDMLNFDYRGTTEWHCPIVIFAGRHDFTTPSGVTAEWFAKIQAPSKKLVWFENSAHMIMVEEPGRMLVHLVEDVRPLAK
jgi:proline iminopeptidase